MHASASVVLNESQPWDPDVLTCVERTLLSCWFLRGDVQWQREDVCRPGQTSVLPPPPIRSDQGWSGGQRPTEADNDLLIQQQNFYAEIQL